MKFSKFGEKLSRRSGILELMEDLSGEASAGERILMLGGGAPAAVPEAEKMYRSRMEEILSNGREFENMIGRYCGPEGEKGFISNFCSFMNEVYGLGIENENVIVTNGSQSSFFLLFNLLAGEFSGGERKEILFPLVPEYIGYTDTGLSENFFAAHRPEIEEISDHSFHYKIDFDTLPINSYTAALCVSRPTNPTGNVLSPFDLQKLSAIAGREGIPLIVDGAYGEPFPGIVYENTGLFWDPNMILTFSLSKVGLPGVRTGIIVANREISQALSRMNAVMNLAVGSVGPVLFSELLADGRIRKLCNESIRPFYQAKRDIALEIFHDSMNNSLPYFVHRCDGAFFLWVWFRDIPGGSLDFYKRLKKRGVIIVPGDYYFPGMTDDWRHKKECLRISFAGEEAVLREGISIIAEEAEKLYNA